MASDMVDWLMRLTLAGSGAILTVLLMRGPMRRLAGGAAAYPCWLIVPLAMLGAALPQLSVATPAVVRWLAPPAAATLVAAAMPLATGWACWVVLGWLGGALATLALFWLGQHAFVRGLGRLTEQGRFVLAEHASGPLLLGLWQARIVVPADFATRYTLQEQGLILAHEHMHATRRDPLANAALALLQCLFWFNPLVHLAAARCRFDQELACDAAVMAVHQGQRQAYAAAMLKTPSAGAPALATCHWQSSHPLKERIMQLKHTTPGPTRRFAGRTIVTLLACAGLLSSVAVRAAAPQAAQSYAITMQLDGGANLALQGSEHQDLHVRWGEAPTTSSSVLRVSGAGPQAVFVKMKISQNGAVVGEPSLLLKLDQPGTVSIGETGKPGAVKMTVTVSRAAEADS